ncbi:MAG: HAD hydrolase family protein [Clostridia bacterium]|nr:HAD hydrolase family protein [Clostridia bacterium]
MKYKLIVSDFDGTLGEAPAEIQPSTVEVVKEYVNRGGKFVICTGRMFAGIKPICDKYGIKGIVISYQGATIDDLSTGKRILEGGIDYELAAKVTADLMADGMPVCVDVEDVMYCEKESEYTEYHKGFTDVKIVNDLVGLVKAKQKPVMKVVTAGEPDVIYHLVEKYSEKYKGQLIANGGSDRLIEIVSPDFTKGKSVRFLQKYFNIPFEEIMAVGDSTNDIELLNGPWHGVAVGDCRQELKPFAKEITVPFKEKPIEHLIKKYCL